jgi:hypothetical protein
MFLSETTYIFLPIFPCLSFCGFPLCLLVLLVCLSFPQAKFYKFSSTPEKTLAPNPIDPCEHFLKTRTIQSPAKKPYKNKIPGTST